MRIQLLLALALTACRPHHELEMVPRMRGATAPGISTVTIQTQCGITLPVDAEPPWWAPAPEASNISALGCPYHDQLGSFYVVDLALRAAGYQVEPSKSDATDGVVTVQVTEYKHCLMICRDISTVVTITLTDAKTGREAWSATCDARSTEKPAHDLVPDATSCAANKLAALALEREAVR